MRHVLALLVVATVVHPIAAQTASDSLRLTRRQAIVEALLRNAQLDIARE